MAAIPKSASPSVSTIKKRKTLDPLDEAVMEYIKTPKEVYDSHQHFCMGLAMQM